MSEGVFINMEMPKDCDALLHIHPDGRAVLYPFNGTDEPHEFTAVTVPPHGDLIERKAAYDSLLHGMVMTGYQSRALDCIAEYSVPTIIPAEEGET